MILIAYRHGLRASELCALQWDQVDLAHGRLHVSRAKNGVPSVHPLGGVELRALRRLQRDQEDSRYVFLSERGAPMGPPGFRRRMVARLGVAAKIPFPVHPHMPSVHPLGGVELRALRRLQRDQEDSRYVFLSERGAPMGPPGFRRMVARLGCSRQDSVPSPPAHAPARLRLQVRASIPAGRLSAERWRCALEPRQAAPLHGGALPR
jgi:hypothetical protein